MKKYKINEIFYSIQGEGLNSGKPAIFVRFSSCNFKCSFCDTNFKKFISYSLLDLEEKINSILHKIPYFNLPIIVWTGGEPLLQLDFDLLNHFHNLDFKNYVESNGSILINNKLRSVIDYLTISPKYKEFPKSFLQREGDELKLIYQNQTEDELSSFLLLEFDNFYLQPCSNKNVKKIINIIKRNPRWSLSIQLQKILKIK